jgi:hypothetical protein
MAASLAYRFDYIAAGASAGVFLHSYSDNEAVIYSAVVYDNVSPHAGRINMTQGETFRHVDGTVARTVYIQNLDTSGNPFRVDILQIIETI